MTRKLTLAIILILLIIGCYTVILGDNPGIREKVAGISQLENTSEMLNSQIISLDQITNEGFDQKKKELEKTIEDYKTTKSEYEEVLEKFSEETAQTLLEIQDAQSEDVYDVDFLWTIIGNYATEEGINLQFDINKNTSSPSSINNTSSDYIVCDLKFTITGKYINLTDFIYDLEDDDRLNFEINDFTMQKEGEDLLVTLNIKEVKINADNLIQSSMARDYTRPMNEETDTQKIDSNTTSKAQNATN